MWTCYKAAFLSVLGKLHALPATLFKQGLLGLPAISKQKRWQHRKASVSCLLGSSLLVSGSCSVPASHSGLCVPSTRWTLADGNTILLFNYLKCCMQINLWHSTTEQGVCGRYLIFDALFRISFFIRLQRWFWFAVLTHVPCSFCGSPVQVVAHLLLCTGTTWQAVSNYKPQGQSATFTRVNNPFDFNHWWTEIWLFKESRTQF